MPSQTDIQNTILSASYKMATLSLANYNLINSGNIAQNQGTIFYIRLNVAALQWQFNIGDYTSATTTTLYDRLNGLVGFDTTINSLDPNAQIPNTVIQIINPASYTPPIDFGWADFSTDGSPDGGINRITYYNTAWKGLNPMLWSVAPAGTALFLGTDYTLIPTGGIVLLATGNFPTIQQGQELRATGYELA